MLLDPDNINLLYNLGCNMVSLRDFDRALELLAPVFARAQHQNLLWFKRDTSLDPVRSDPRYQAMESAAEARLATSASN
jgi:adenylate cyclase